MAQLFQSPFFQSPWWLAALLPWAGLLLIQMRRPRKRSPVPFSQLWAQVAQQNTVRTTPWRLPPVAILLMLVAMAASILAGAGPLRGKKLLPTLTLIIDRGMTMSALVDAKSRFTILGDSLLSCVDDCVAPGGLKIEAVPALENVNWNAISTEAMRTAVDTRELLPQVVDRALLDGPVLAVTDQQLHNVPGVVVGTPIAPDSVGIVRVALRNEPKPQVMVRLLNNSAQRSVDVTAGQVHQTVALPERGGQVDAFVDLKSSVDRVAVVLDKYANNADGRAWATARSAGPPIEARGDVGTPLRRLLAAYEKHRSIDPALKPIGIGDIGDTNESGVALATSLSASSCAGELIATPSPLTDGVTFPSIAQNGATSLPAGNDWQVVLRGAGLPLLAMRETPVRQVWVNFADENWAKTPDYVVFWTKVLDWVSGRDKAIGLAAVGTLDESWNRQTPAPADAEARLWPGLFTRANEFVAVNAPSEPLRSAVTSDWEHELRALAAGAGSGATWSDWLICAALACVCLGICFWGVR